MDNLISHCALLPSISRFSGFFLSLLGVRRFVLRL